MNLFGVVITLLEGDQPVMNVTHDPVRGETFETVRGGGARLNGEPIRVSDPAPLAGKLVHMSFPRDKGAWMGSMPLILTSRQASVCSGRPA